MSLIKVKGSVWDSVDNNLAVNVKDFGAVGDGSDETSIFQAAIDYANEQCVPLQVPYTASGYGLTTINLPDNNITIIGSEFTTNRPILQHLNTTGNMFQVSSPTVQTHSINIIGFDFRGAAGATTSIGLYIDPTYNTFGLKLINNIFYGFDVQVHAEALFWSRIERNSFEDYNVGFYGGSDIDNVYINNVPRTGETNSIGMWILGSKSVIIAGDTGAADTEAGATQYMIGNDTSVTSPSTNITAKQKTASANFIGTHFEFSDLAGLGTIQDCFVDVRSGSTADFEKCHFMNRTPGLPVAIIYRYLTKTATINNCQFAVGPANVALGDGDYTNHINVVSRLAGAGFVKVINSDHSEEITLTGVADYNDSLNFEYPVCSVVTLSANQTSVAASGVTVLFNTRLGDIHNNLDLTTYTFTAPVAGFYKVTGSLMLGNGTYQVDMGHEVHIYGTSGIKQRIRYVTPSNSTYDFSMPIDTVIPCAHGDTLYVQLYHTSATLPTILGGGTTSRLCISKVN